MTQENKILQSIFEFVAQETSVSVSDIKSKSRLPHLVNARFLISHLSRKYNPILNLAQVGSHMNRDHSTIIHHIRKLEDNMSIDKNLTKYVKALEKKYLLELHPIIIQRTTINPNYNEVQSYKREVNKAHEQANKMYYEAISHLNRLLDSINQDNNMEGKLKLIVNNQSIEFKNKMKILKMGLSV